MRSQTPSSLGKHIRTERTEADSLRTILSLIERGVREKKLIIFVPNHMDDHDVRAIEAMHAQHRKQLLSKANFLDGEMQQPIGRKR